MANEQDRNFTNTPNVAEVLPVVAETIGALAEIMQVRQLDRLEITVGGVVVRLWAGANKPQQSTTMVEQVCASNPTASASLPPVSADAAAEPGQVIAAPMIGTYYASPSPSDPPFVTVGDRIEAGQTIGIIEAMKIMNEIPADRSGFVTEVLAISGQPVEYGSPLMRVSSAPGGAR